MDKASRAMTSQAPTTDEQYGPVREQPCKAEESGEVRQGETPPR